MKNMIANINPATFTGSAIIIGFLLIDDLSVEEQSSIGNWLELVGMVLITYSSQITTNQSVQKNDTDNNSDSNYNIDTLKKTVDKIKECLDKM